MRKPGMRSVVCAGCTCAQRNTDFAEAAKRRATNCAARRRRCASPHVAYARAEQKRGDLCAHRVSSASQRTPCLILPCARPHQAVSPPFSRCNVGVATQKGCLEPTNATVQPSCSPTYVTGYHKRACATAHAAPGCLCCARRRLVCLRARPAAVTRTSSSARRSAKTAWRCWRAPRTRRRCSAP